MKLLTQPQAKAAIRNSGKELDQIKPVAKLFCPWGAATWLVCEMDPENPDIISVVADLGQGCVEYGSASLAEIASLRGPFGLKIERDIHWSAGDKTAADFFNAGCEAGRLVA
jgi:hypothetical protein